MLKIGIVGLPNVGKSTLFNALLKKSSFAASFAETSADKKASGGQAGGFAKIGNFPFTTIDPNIGVVAVPDSRLDALASVIASEAKQFPVSVIPAQAGIQTKNMDPRSESGMTTKRPPIVPAAVQFYDIAGLVAGASKGEGLGNKFLSHIKEVDAIIHVVRLFDDSEILRTGDSVPGTDIAIVETELILKDLETISRQSRPHKKLEKEEVLFYDTVDILRQKLDEGLPARAISLSDIQREAIKPLNLLTIKPVLYVFNLSENQIHSHSEHSEESLAPVIPAKAGIQVNKMDPRSGSGMTIKYPNSLYICAKLESDIVTLSEDEQAEYLKEYGLEEPGLSRLIKAGYKMLGLISFLTAGVKEVRAWTIPQGTLAPQAAAVIHTDFEKHFIKAEVAKFDDFVSLGGWQKCREAGKVTFGGRDYIMRDGDVVDFKVNA